MTELGQWFKATQGDEAKLSVWAAGTDLEVISGKPDWTWCKTAAASLRAPLQLGYCPQLAEEIRRQTANVAEEAERRQTTSATAAGEVPDNSGTPASTTSSWCTIQ